MHDRADDSSALWKCTADVTLRETDTEEGGKIPKFPFPSLLPSFILTVIRATLRREWNNQTGWANFTHHRLFQELELELELAAIFKRACLTTEDEGGYKRLVISSVEIALFAFFFFFFFFLFRGRDNSWRISFREAFELVLARHV